MEHTRAVASGPDSAALESPFPPLDLRLLISKVKQLYSIVGLQETLMCLGHGRCSASVHSYPILPFQEKGLVLNSVWRS